MTEFNSLLERMSRIAGVRGVMVAAVEEGLVVDADLMIGVPGEPVAALVSSLFKRARRSVTAADLGEVAFMQVEAESGNLFAAAPSALGDLILVVVAERWANVGMVRVEMSREVEALA